jgi:hypothetical protein
MIMIISKSFTSEISLNSKQNSPEQNPKNLTKKVQDNVVKSLKTTGEEIATKNSISNDISEGNSKAIPNLFGNMGSSSSKKKNKSESYSGELGPCSKDQKKNINKYQKKLGQGTAGDVFGSSKSNEVVKQIKVVPNSPVEDVVKNEIENLLLFQNADLVVNTHEACYEDDSGERYYYIFMEKCSEDFEDWYNKTVSPGDVDNVKNIFKQIAAAYIELHSEFVLQRDIQIANWMICDSKIKIIDLGQSTKIESFDSNGPHSSEIKNEFTKMFRLFTNLLKIKNIEGTPLNNTIDNIRKEIAAGKMPDLNDFIDELRRRVLLVL